MLQNFKRLLHSKKGFTLLELVIAMTVSTVLMLGVAGIMPSLMRTHARSIDHLYARAIANSVEEALQNELSFATDISVTDGGARLTYTGDYGQKTIDGQADPPVIEGLAYDQKYYMGKTVTIAFSYAADVVTADVTVTGQQGNLLEESRRLIRVYSKSGQSG